MSLVAVLQGRPPDGRGNTGFYEIVRLGEADKKSIADRGYTVVDLNDATAEPAVFAFILFCRDAVDIWLAALRLAADIRMLNVSRDEGDVAALAPLVLLSVSGG